MIELKMQGILIILEKHKSLKASIRFFNLSLSSYLVESKKMTGIWYTIYTITQMKCEHYPIEAAIQMIKERNQKSKKQKNYWVCFRLQRRYPSNPIYVVDII